MNEAIRNPFLSESGRFFCDFMPVNLLSFVQISQIYKSQWLPNRRALINHMSIIGVIRSATPAASLCWTNKQLKYGLVHERFMQSSLHQRCY